MTLRTISLLLIVVTAVIAAKAQKEQLMTVNELFELVESNSKTLQSQKISVEFAQKGIEVARLARLPEVNVSASVSLNGDVLVTDRDFTGWESYGTPRWGNSLALEAQQVVYAGGAIDAGIRLAELQAEKAKMGVLESREQQRFLTLGQYLEIFKLRNREQVFTQNIELTQLLIEDIKAKYEQGMALKNDVTRYELQLETLKLQLKKLRDQRAILNHQLINQLGLPPHVEIVPDENVISESYGNEGESIWQERAIEESPMMRQMELSSQMAHQEVRIARSDKLPKVALVAADNFSGPFTYDIPALNKNINYWYLGIGVKYSVSSLFKSGKKIDHALAGVRQADQARMVAAEQLNNQVQQAYTYYQQAYIELATQRKSVELARQNYQVISDRYLSQLALVTDMIDASNAKLDSELNEVDALIGIAWAYYRLKYVSGTL